MRLTGRVESGQGNAAHWLRLFNAPYSRKVGWTVLPGSLNLRLRDPFDWNAPEIREHVVQFRREEYVGERDILLLPCVLTTCSRQPGYLWTTTTVDPDPDARRVVEVIAPVRLREAYSLVDGDVVEFEVPPIGRESGP